MNIIKLEKHEVDIYGKKLFEFLFNRKEINDFKYFNEADYLSSLEKDFVCKKEFVIILFLLEQNIVGCCNSFIVNDSILLNFEVLPSYYNKNLVKDILKEIYNTYDNKYKIFIQIRDELKPDLETFFSVTKRLNNICFNTATKDLNYDLLNEWEKKITQMNSNIYYRIFNDMPENILEDYLDILKESLDDIPQEMIKVDNSVSSKYLKSEATYYIHSNYKIYYILLFNKNDEIIGFTNGIVNKKYPYNAKQFMTGVKKEYRRNGHSKWLKPLFIKTIMEDKTIIPPKTITTGTSINNHPIIKLSKAIGMKQTSVRKEYLLCRK